MEFFEDSKEMAIGINDAISFPKADSCEGRLRVLLAAPPASLFRAESDPPIALPRNLLRSARYFRKLEHVTLVPEPSRKPARGSKQQLQAAADSAAKDNNAALGEHVPAVLRNVIWGRHFHPLRLHQHLQTRQIPLLNVAHHVVALTSLIS